MRRVWSKKRKKKKEKLKRKSCHVSPPGMSPARALGEVTQFQGHGVCTRRPPGSHLPLESEIRFTSKLAQTARSPCPPGARWAGPGVPPSDIPSLSRRGPSLSGGHVRVLRWTRGRARALALGRGRDPSRVHLSTSCPCSSGAGALPRLWHWGGWGAGGRAGPQSGCLYPCDRALYPTSWLLRAPSLNDCNAACNP